MESWAWTSFHRRKQELLVGKTPILVFFWGGGFELFTVKFASKAVEYPVSITCGVESAQLSLTATTLWYVEDMTWPGWPVQPVADAKSRALLNPTALPSIVHCREVLGSTCWKIVGSCVFQGQEVLGYVQITNDVLCWCMKMMIVWSWIFLSPR